MNNHAISGNNNKPSTFTAGSSLSSQNNTIEPIVHAEVVNSGSKRSVILPIEAASREAQELAEILRTDLMECLIAKGADPNSTTDQNVNAALQMALQRRYSFAVIEYLLEHKADPNAKDENHNTALQIASNVGCSRDVIRLLLKNGAAVNVPDVEEETLLQCLVSWPSLCVAAFWNDICCPGSILLSSSGAQDLAEVLRINLLTSLLEKQEGLEKEKTPGETLLQIAFSVGRSPDVIKLLIKNEANVNVRDATGKTLLQSLIGMSSDDVAWRWRDICCPNNIEAASSEAQDLAEVLRMDLVKCLLEYGAEIKENVALPNALRTQFSLDILSHLLQKEVNPPVRDVEMMVLPVLMEMDNNRIVLECGVSSEPDALATVQALRMYLIDNLLSKNFNPLRNKGDLKLLKLAKKHKNKEWIVFLGKKMENTWKSEIKVKYFRSFSIWLKRLWNRSQVWRLTVL